MHFLSLPEDRLDHILWQGNYIMYLPGACTCGSTLRVLGVMCWLCTLSVLGFKIFIMLHVRTARGSTHLNVDSYE